MDQSKKLKTSSESDFPEESSDSSSSSDLGHNLRPEKMVEVKEEESISHRKIQKADRERLRRDKLNKQFIELGNSLDPNRPKSDKASILNDTIQMLKDLMNQVDQLKAEYATLSQESRELVQEKRELREEKATLKSDIEILNVQYQHKVRTMVPWIPHYTYPIPVSIPPQIQPFDPLSGAQDLNLSSLLQSSINPLTEQALSSPTSSKQDSKLSLDLNLMKNSNHSDKEDDVGLELELKIHAYSSAKQDAKEKKGTSKPTSSSPNSC